MIIIIFILLMLTTSIHTGVIQVFNSSNINNTETMMNGNQSLINIADQNQFAETVVDLLLDLLEKANLSRTVSVIHNGTKLTELVEQDDDDDIKTNTIKLSFP